MNCFKMARFPHRFVRGRKAQAESQLNWIFILIVGAVILAFFAYIVLKQRAASEAKFAGKVSTQLNTILVGAKVSSGTVQEIPTPDLEIRFTCNDYYIGPASQRLGNRVLFAPEYLEGNKLITWTLDWNVPFKVTGLLYLTSPTVRYIVIGSSLDEPAADGLFDALPQKLNKQMFSIADYDAGGIRDEGDLHVRFIFVDVGDSFNAPEGFDDVDISGLVVKSAGGGPSGLPYVQFLERSGTALVQSGARHTYMEDEVLYGAIFSDDADIYECLMGRAYSRLNMVARVYYEKLNVIAPEFDATHCEGLYRDNPDLDLLIKATGVYPPSYGDIGQVKSALKEKNTRAQLRSCPLIY